MQDKEEIAAKRGLDGRFLPGSPALNPNGRPKGSVSQVPTKLTNYLRARAAEDFEEIYQGILIKAKKGEPWANSLFVKDLLPQKYKEDRVQNLIAESDSVNDSLANLIKMFSAPDDYSISEAANILKIINSVKMTENVASETLASKLSDEKLIAIKKMLDESDKKDE